MGAMSTKLRLSNRSLSFVTIEPSGSVTVDLEGFLKTPDGVRQRTALKAIRERMQSRPERARSRERTPVG
jgi:hypothetical protein